MKADITSGDSESKYYKLRHRSKSLEFTPGCFLSSKELLNSLFQMEVNHAYRHIYCLIHLVMGPTIWVSWKYPKCSTVRWVTDILLVNFSLENQIWKFPNIGSVFICDLSPSKMSRTLFLQFSNLKMFSFLNFNVNLRKLSYLKRRSYLFTYEIWKN